MKAVNLIPSEQRSGGASLAGSSEGGAFIVLGLVAGLAVLALLYGMAHHHIASRSGQVAVLSGEAAAAQAQANQLAPYTSFVATRDKRQQAISQLVESRFDWAHAFHELGRVLPFDVSLSSVQGSAGSTTPAAAPATGTAAASTAVASATPPGTAPTFTVVGCATSQSEVAKTLDRLRLIDGVTNVELQSSAKSEGSGGSSGSTCPAANDPSFTAQVTFAPLPTPAASSTSAGGTTATAATAAPGATGSTAAASTPAAASTTPAASTSTTPAAPTGGS
jgi:Tfp pilus assembly protein PilN